MTRGPIGARVTELIRIYEQLTKTVEYKILQIFKCESVWVHIENFDFDEAIVFDVVIEFENYELSMTCGWDLESGFQVDSYHYLGKYIMLDASYFKEYVKQLEEALS